MASVPVVVHLGMITVSVVASAWVKSTTSTVIVANRFHGHALSRIRWREVSRPTPGVLVLPAFGWETWPVPVCIIIGITITSVRISITLWLALLVLSERSVLSRESTILIEILPLLTWSGILVTLLIPIRLWVMIRLGILIRFWKLISMCRCRIIVVSAATSLLFFACTCILSWCKIFFWRWRVHSSLFLALSSRAFLFASRLSVILGLFFTLALTCSFIIFFLNHRSWLASFSMLRLWLGLLLVFSIILLTIGILLSCWSPSVLIGSLSVTSGNSFLVANILRIKRLLWEFDLNTWSLAASFWIFQTAELSNWVYKT